MNKPKIIIAIDGYSSTGKSTIAKMIANKLGYIYVDTGAMYRAIALYAMQNEIISEDIIYKKKLISSLHDIDVSFKYNSDLGFSETYLNRKNVEKEIRSIEVSNNVSRIAAISEVRKKLVAQQQLIGLNKGIVMDGRDIGTVVFPNAELKVFMTASAHIRAQRRYDEMFKKGDDITYEAVLENVMTRDYIDTTREDSPLLKANDAIEIDSAELNVEETFDEVYQYIKQKLEVKS
ncbi:MAG: (d)CMP kinase [Flavobacteriaceae bacterium]|nr:(d)CMP kinase [Flavobacteriaceae bacterium]